MLKDELLAVFPVVLSDLALAAVKIQNASPLAAYRIRVLREILFGMQDRWQELEDLMHQETIKGLKEIITAKGKENENGKND